MPINLRKLSITKDQPIRRKILIAGRTGSGKTHLAGSAQDVPEMSSVLCASIDGGVSTLASRGDILYDVTRSINSVEELMWLLIRKDPSVAGVQTLILDGASEMQKADLAELAETAAKKINPNKEKQRDKDSNELLDYKKNKSRMLRILRMARDIPDINLIVTCWTAEQYPVDPVTQMPNKTGKPLRVWPDLSQSVRDVALGYFDDVWTLIEDKGSRYLYTGDVKGVFGKTRDPAVAKAMSTEISGELTPVLINPTFSDIYARYKKAYNQV
jgi:hypothetical protein